MAKRCVFCGLTPEKRSKEHVLPKWLIEATGRPREPVTLGVDRRTGKPRVFPFKNLTLPACKACNAEFGELEGDASRVVKALLSGGSLTEPDVTILLDWLDKIRIGLWLWELALAPNTVSVRPRFHVRQRIRQKDRLAFWISLEEGARGLSLIGTQTYAFLRTPSCFGLAINNVALLSISFDYLLAERLGFPYLDSWHVIGGNQPEFALIKPGTGKVSPPMLPGYLRFPGIAFGQCLFNEHLDKEQIRQMYEEPAIKELCAEEIGESVVFVGFDERVRPFADFQGSGGLPNALQVNATYRSWFPLEVLRIQHYLVGRWPQTTWSSSGQAASVNDKRRHALDELDALIALCRLRQQQPDQIIT